IFLQVALDLRQGEAIAGAFVPVGFAVDGVEQKAEGLGERLPAGAWGDGVSEHDGPSLVVLETPHRRPGGAPMRNNVAPQLPGSTRQVRDRKSTRLNSSHVKISYAVFCLKKKKTKK